MLLVSVDTHICANSVFNMPEYDDDVNIISG